MEITWKETIGADEDARFTRLGKQLVEIQRSVAARHPKGRALHYKAHGGLRAELTTAAAVPDWARVGIFASAASYPAYVRFSNGSWLPQRDGAADVRGVGVKVVGVPGKKLIPGMTEARTQD